MKKGILILISVFYFGLVSLSQNYRVKLFSNEQGLPDNYLYSILQDREGFLWLAGAKGLSRFDGQVFKHYTLNNSSEDDFIYAASCGSGGELFFGSFNGKIYRYEKSTDQLVPYTKSVNGSVNKIATSAKNGQLYIASNGNGIYEVKRDTLVQITGTENYEILHLEILANKHLFFVSPEGVGNIDVSTNKVTAYEEVSPGIKQLQALQEPGKYLVLTVDNQFLLLEYDKTNHMLKTKWNTLVVSKEKELSAFFYDEIEQELFIGTTNGEFFRVSKQKQESSRLFEKELLLMPGAILKDRENNLWVATGGKGLFRFSRTEFQVLGTGNESVFALAQDHIGNYYMGTSNGIQVISSGGNPLKAIKQVGKVALQKITALYLDNEGVLWIGTENQGLLLLNINTLKQEQLEFSGIENISINAINGNFRNKRVQVCTNLDGVYHYDDYRLTNHFSVENNFPHNNVLSSARNKYGKTFYATHKTGFSFSKGNHVFEINPSDPQLTFDFNTFAEDAEGNIAVGTNGDGVYRLSDTVITRYPFNKKLSSNYCIGLSFDKQDNLWILERYGIYKYHRKDSVLEKMSRSFDAEWLLNPKAIYAGIYGEVLVGTNKNVLLFSKQYAGPTSPLAPKSYFLKIKLFDSLLDIQKTLELKNGKYNLSFEFSALSLSNSEAVTFKYLLEGHDQEWSEPTRNRKLDFSNLGEGKYSFKVMAISAAGFQEKEPLRFDFEIKPPFWKRPLFWVSTVILLVILVLYIIRLRTASLLKAKLLLEKRVEEQTKELKEEREIILQNQQVIEDQNSYITQSITYARRLQFATLPPKGTMQQHLPDSFIFYSPKDIVSGDFYWMSLNEDVIYIAAADCTGHGVPGAMLTMVCSNALEKTIMDDELKTIGEKLEKTFELISVSLTRSGEIIHDGMDISMVSINLKSKEVHWSGSGNPLFYIKDGAVQIIKSDTPSLVNGQIIKSYSSHSVELKKGDSIYLLSDGYIDQFGGPNYKRFQKKQFVQTLERLKDFDMQAQGDMFEKTLREWQGELKQTDDICLVGIRF